MVVVVIFGRAEKPWPSFQEVMLMLPPVQFGSPDTACYQMRCERRYCSLIFWPLGSSIVLTSFRLPDTPEWVKIDPLRMYNALRFRVQTGTLRSPAILAAGF